MEFFKYTPLLRTTTLATLSTSTHNILILKTGKAKTHIIKIQ
jgi:hypothetical protein